MNNRIIAIPFVTALLAIVLVSSASAQVQRTFVSGLGSDSNPCNRAAPCRTFGQAISQTNGGGEVYVLDTAGYGPVTITQSVAIVAPQGVTAGISVFSGNGININVGPSDTVILRGLTLTNQGSSANGIQFTGGGALQVENCVINGFSGAGANGLVFLGGTLEVKDCVISGNATGISVATPSGTSLATIDRVRLERNAGSGLIATGVSKVTIRDSIASANARGFTALSFLPAPGLELNVENCVASNNSDHGIGAEVSGAGAGATVRVSNSTITGNNLGLFNGGSPSVLLSRGNNTVEGNGTDASGTVGSYSAK